MIYDPRGLGPMHHEDPDRYADLPGEPERDCAICAPGQCPGSMCPGSLAPEPCPGSCGACGPRGCDPACQVCAAERAAYEAHLASLDHDCPRQEFLDDPITVAYGVGAEMIRLVPCAICDAQEAGL